MTEPLVTMSLTEYNRLIDRAADQVEFVAKERNDLQAFVLELANECERQQQNARDIPDVLRRTVGVWMKRGTPAPVKAQVPP